MSKAIQSAYAPNTVNAMRVDTDTLFIDEKAAVAFGGTIDKNMRYIENIQMLDPVVWARFVEQFRLQHDIKNYGWKGEYWGKMMRGATFVYAYTKNPALFAMLRQTVEDMLSTIEDSGRISSYPADKEFRGWDVWCRKYVLLGLQYFMEICDDAALNARIVASLEAQVGYIMSKIGSPADGKTPITKTASVWRGLASSSLLEPVVRLYALTKKQEYLDFADHIIACGGTTVANIFELAYEDKTDPYQYPITKAYEMISCFEGLLEYYRATGIEKHKTTVINFARRLAKTDITIIGSAGCTHEYFDHAAARQTDTAYQGIMQETCVTVTWMKFCMQVLALTGDPMFADLFEQALYNAYLGAVNTEQNVDELVLEKFPDAILEPLPFDSYASLLPNTRGRGIGGLQVMADNHYYGCCACIGAAGIGMANKVAVMLSKNGVAINLYENGTVTTSTPNGKLLTLKMATAYPCDGQVDITVETDDTDAFDIALRIPEWSAKTALAVNGEAVDVHAGYTAINRVWKAGDIVSLTLDMRTKVLRPVSNPHDVIFVDIIWAENYVSARKVEETPEAKYHLALRRGPLVLARDARLDGTIDEAIDVACDEDGYVELAPANSAKFDTLVNFTVPQPNGSTFTVIDYASAGKTWDERSKYACWLPTKEYWR